MTAWLANWFTQGDSLCFHEGSLSYGSLESLLEINKNDDGRVYGDSNSGLPLICPEDIIRYQDDFNIGYVNRDFDTCAESYNKVNPDPTTIDTFKVITDVNKSLQNLLTNIDYAEIPYDNLFSEEDFKIFHQQLTPSIPFCSTRYRILKDLQVTQKVKEVYEREYRRRL